MLMKYSLEISNEAISSNLHRLINQIYKLLPSREESLEWQKPLETIIEEFSGMSRILIGQREEEILFQLLCKLEGLQLLTEEEDFPSYRRVIFECLSLCSDLKSLCQDSQI